MCIMYILPCEKNPGVVNPLVSPIGAAQRIIKNACGINILSANFQQIERIRQRVRVIPYPIAGRGYLMKMEEPIRDRFRSPYIYQTAGCRAVWIAGVSACDMGYIKKITEKLRASLMPDKYLSIANPG